MSEATLVSSEDFLQGERWYAVYTRRSKEHFVDARLIQMGIETLLPLITKKSRGKYQISPLFPCYLFARFDAWQSLYRINHTDGVNRVVSFNDRPKPIDTAIVEALRSRQAMAGLVPAEGGLVPGIRVRVQGGVFDGYEGKIESIKPSDRVIILLNAIIGIARLTVEPDRLEIIK